MDSISPVKFDSLVNDVVERLPKRTKTVIVRRFGLKNGKYETLDAIGQDYGITRERVRQIESDGLKQLSHNDALEQLTPAVLHLENHFSDHGHVRSEESVLKHLSGQDHPHPQRQAIYFVLTITDPFLRYGESDAYHTHWVTDEKAKERAGELIKHLVAKFVSSKNRTWSREELLNAASEYLHCDRRIAESYIGISKQILQNVFGEYGLADWPEISPRGVRDKAYLVLKRNGKPLHFSEITEHINQAKFSERKAYVQTVHNELIKDERFVLVGRGLYALSDWGYNPGTVREVLAEILKDLGPLTKDEVLAETMKRRMVRPNTILLNLQNSPMFIRTENGRYTVAA